jgi:hypothetical protein
MGTLETVRGRLILKIIKNGCRKKFIPKLPLIFVFVLNNKPYHSVLLERAPSSNTRKVIMINWLSSHGIPYSDAMFMPQL